MFCLIIQIMSNWLCISSFKGKILIIMNRVYFFFSKKNKWRQIFLLMKIEGKNVPDVYVW